MAEFIGVIDQGTTSTKFLIFDRQGRVVYSSFKEHRWYCPEKGWIEQDGLEIFHHVLALVEEALTEKPFRKKDLAALGITNQRETTLLWDKKTGIPLSRAIVWQDSRTSDLVREFSQTKEGIYRYHHKTGLPLSTYFSGLKLLWLLQNLPGARQKAASGELLFGTVDSFLAWKLSGGPQGGKHCTDVTNASRTQLFNINSLKWDQEILEELDIPSLLLPEVVPSASFLSEAKVGILKGVPLAGLIGDQQAALIGQGCINFGEGKCTYGTGAFLLFNTADKPIFSRKGLITTLAYMLNDGKVCYALEGSTVAAGSAVRWLKELLGLKDEKEVEKLAAQAKDNGGIYFVPAFNGLFSPYWDPQARATILGLSWDTQGSHLARAVLEATAFQVGELFELIQKECGMEILELKVDGGMIKNDQLMQFQADILNRKLRAADIEATSLGAAFVAGLAVGLLSGIEEIDSWRKTTREWVPTMEPAQRERLLRYWKKAVQKASRWIE
ncbi:glycerol kinase GlpK [Candidatus Methylacidiphilum infernorum]|uniref:ATP:glycerol 3-phosphotransferase n=1 Tax=Candidatus Methylacidiphilum infernorum TaxID=511746 RepID=A0ABX7PYI6_9BACT|nr:glycerol kinase GlpK [Candidatus Methylacidiphilum infernorum]QSR87723.1 glycerol kinase GlpK [Candidatus Methylacidiphilum infernorum]